MCWTWKQLRTLFFRKCTRGGIYVLGTQWVVMKICWRKSDRDIHAILALALYNIQLTFFLIQSQVHILCYRYQLPHLSCTSEKQRPTASISTDCSKVLMRSHKNDFSTQRCILVWSAWFCGCDLVELRAGLWIKAELWMDAVLGLKEFMYLWSKDILSFVTWRLLPDTFWWGRGEVIWNGPRLN